MISEKEPDAEALKAWAGDHLKKVDGVWTRARALFEDWARVADDLGVAVGTARRFSRRLEELGFPRGQKSGLRARYHQDCSPILKLPPVHHEAYSEVLTYLINRYS